VHFISELDSHSYKKCRKMMVVIDGINGLGLVQHSRDSLAASFSKRGEAAVRARPLAQKRPFWLGSRPLSLAQVIVKHLVAGNRAIQ
jgi:hypothetical protein